MSAPAEGKRPGAWWVWLLAVTAFCAGVFEPELRAQGGLPEHVFSLRPTGSGEDLDPISSYNKALRLIREHYDPEPGSPPAPSGMQLTYTAIRGLMGTLDDPYSRFLDPEEYRLLMEDNEGEFEGIGAQLYSNLTAEGYIRIFRPIPGGPAERAGIRKGDVILKIEGVSIKGLPVDEAVRRIRGKSNTPVRLTVRHTDGKVAELKIVRQQVEYEVVESSLKPGGIGYVYLRQFNELADARLYRAIRNLEQKGMKGLILDLRGNPGGLLDQAIYIVSRFTKPRSVAVITVEQGEREPKKVDDSRYLGGHWPLVVLVNRTSASASEIVAGAIKDHGAGTVIGTTTFGKGLVQTVIPLEGNAGCLITTAKYLTPNGRDINRSRDHRGGVEPDIVVEISMDQYLKREDPQLRRALEEIQKKISLQSARNR